MKKVYSAPEAEVIDLQAMESVALIEDRDIAKRSVTTDSISDTTGNGDYRPGGY